MKDNRIKDKTSFQEHFVKQLPSRIAEKLKGLDKHRPSRIEEEIINETHLKKPPAKT